MQRRPTSIITNPVIAQYFKTDALVYAAGAGVGLFDKEGNASALGDKAGDKLTFSDAVKATRNILGRCVSDGFFLIFN